MSSVAMRVRNVSPIGATSKTAGINTDDAFFKNSGINAEDNILLVNSGINAEDAINRRPYNH